MPGGAPHAHLNCPLTAAGFAAQERRECRENPTRMRSRGSVCKNAARPSEVQSVRGCVDAARRGPQRGSRVGVAVAGPVPDRSRSCSAPRPRVRGSRLRRERKRSGPPARGWLAPSTQVGCTPVKQSCWQSQRGGLVVRIDCRSKDAHPLRMPRCRRANTRARRVVPTIRIDAHGCARVRE